MTRSTLNRTLRRSYVILALVLVISLVAKLADHIPGIAGTPLENLAKDIYDYLKDMALVFVTVVAAYLANVFQKRQQFLSALKQEWQDILRSKSALLTVTHLEQPTSEQYLQAYAVLSETIDNMRTVYSNVGETGELIGLYPFAPLHDMRRAFQTLDPRKRRDISADERRLARDAILQAFYALRESFLDELDIEAPDKPLLIFGGRRLKKTGAPQWAAKMQEAQRAEHDRLAPPDARIDDMLRAQWQKEHATSKPWRPVANGAGERDPERAPQT